VIASIADRKNFYRGFPQAKSRKTFYFIGKISRWYKLIIRVTVGPMSTHPEAELGKPIPVQVSTKFPAHMQRMFTEVQKHTNWSDQETIRVASWIGLHALAGIDYDPAKLVAKEFLKNWEHMRELASVTKENQSPSEPMTAKELAAELQPKHQSSRARRK
jgi:hypothetical protein